MSITFFFMHQQKFWKHPFQNQHSAFILSTNQQLCSLSHASINYYSWAHLHEISIINISVVLQMTLQFTNLFWNVKGPQTQSEIRIHASLQQPIIYTCLTNIHYIYNIFNNLICIMNTNHKIKYIFFYTYIQVCERRLRLNTVLK